jgi:hypothetical protein
MDRPSTRGTGAEPGPVDSDVPAASSHDLQERLDDLQLTLDAQRQLLRARRPTDLVDTLRAVVHRAGATLVDGEVTGPEVLQIDIGLGVRPPALPWSPPDHPSRAVLQRLLPGLVEDATRLAHRLLEAREQGDVSLRDDLTGALNEAGTRRLLDKLRAGDAVVVAALRPETTDTAIGATTSTSERSGGTATTRSDLALRALAEMVRSELDVDEQLCRLDASGLVVALRHAELERIHTLCQRIDLRWERAHDLTLLLGSVHLDAPAPGLAAALTATFRADADASSDGVKALEHPADIEVRFHAAS